MGERTWGKGACMNPAIVIPSYWAADAVDAQAPGAYDHSTDLNAPKPELDACLASLEQVRDVCRVIVLVVSPPSSADAARERVRAIARSHPALTVTVLTEREAVRIRDRVDRIAPRAPGEPVSLRGYGAIRNMGLAAASILAHDCVIFLDDDEIVLGPDFMKKALYALGQQTRQGLPILAKSGYFYDREGSPLADTSKADATHRWWTKRIEFNRWMRRALSGTRISRSNYVCGGLFALHARAYMRVAFDPWITRGEDLDYLFNMRMHGLDVWFDNEWVVRHLPPPSVHRAPRFMQNVYRWYYERAKLAFAARQHDLEPVTPASLMPYPGPWFSSELDERVRKTAFARMMLTSERVGYGRIWRHGRELAERYADENKSKYIRFQSFWPSIMDGLWNDEELSEMLEEATCREN